jgi:conjugal transfer mating pair stabilization protein TraG
MNYSVITFGGGDSLQAIFNGVAAAVGSNAYLTLIGIVSLFAFVWVVIESIFRQQFQLNVRWFISFFLIYNILLVPKVTIQIDDRVDQQTRIVAHVPWGLAEFASDISQIFYNLTQLAESVYSLPNDLRYTQTGTLLASHLVSASQQFTITAPGFSKNLNQFIQQCVFYDVLLHKYSLQELLSADDLWNFMKKNASPARAFEYDQQIITCREGLVFLDKDWQTELKTAGYHYGLQLFPNHPQPDQQLLTYLPTIYHYLTHIMHSGPKWMQQFMLQNAIQQSMIQKGASIDSSAVLKGYAYTREQRIKQNVYHRAGMIAGHWLSLIKILFESVLYGMFIFIAPFFLMPFGLSLLKNYLYALIWVESWAPLYAVLNLVMTIYARKASLAVTAMSGGHLINLMTSSRLIQHHHDINSLVGYFAISIPIMAYYLTKGGSLSFFALAQTLGHAAGVYSLGANQIKVEKDLYSNHSEPNTQSASIQISHEL